MDDWRELDDDHQWTVGHVFGGLTLLDTVQSEAGLTALKEDVKTPHETAVLNNIQFMESVHAKSYSTIFSLLIPQTKSKKSLNGPIQKQYLQNKAVKIANMYLDPSQDPLKKKVANVFLENFLILLCLHSPFIILVTTN